MGCWLNLPGFPRAEEPRTDNTQGANTEGALLRSLCHTPPGEFHICRIEDPMPPNCKFYFGQHSGGRIASNRPKEWKEQMAGESPAARADAPPGRGYPQTRCRLLLPWWTEPGRSRQLQYQPAGAFQPPPPPPDSGSMPRQDSRWTFTLATMWYFICGNFFALIANVVKRLLVQNISW